jgi:putative nucleotidyltransferase with HDIG domain
VLFGGISKPLVVDPLGERRYYALLAYAAALSGAAVAVMVLLLVNGAGVGSPAAVAVLAGLAVLAERGSIRLSPALEVSVASLTFIFAAVVFGPLAAVLVGAAGLLADLRAPYLRWLIWTSARVIAAAGAGVAAAVIGGHRSLLMLFAAVGAASLVDVVADLTFHSITPALRGTASFTEAVRALVPLQLSSIPLHTPVIAVLAYAYIKVSPWSVAFFVAPAFAAQRLFLLYRQQRDSAGQLSAANQRLERANVSFATALVATLDARDRCTAGHSAAVAIYARDIATRMNLSTEEQHLAHLCGLVHDIGKVGLPAGLLEKPGPLTLEERRQMEKHSIIGERILRNVEDYSEIASVVRHHHERVDGQGYPDGLRQQEIPLLSKIISVADAYNAMTSDRPYRDAMPSRVARLRLAQAVESQFDTSVVAAFEAILAGASECYRLGQREDFDLASQDHYSARDSAALPRVASA